MSKKSKSAPKENLDGICRYCDNRLPVRKKIVKSNGRRHELDIHFKEEKINGAVEISVFPCDKTQIVEIKEKYSR